VKTVVFLTFLLIFGVIYPQDQNEISRSISYSAEPVGNQKGSDPLEESYKDNDYERMQEIIIYQERFRKKKFKASADFEAAKYHNFYKTNKSVATAFQIIGSIAFVTGLSLFIHDKTGGENSLTAQYTLMLGGLSMAAGGTAISNVASESLIISKGYKEIAEKYTGDNRYTLEEYYSNSGIQAKNRKEIAKSFETHGAALIALSIPMFVVAIYGFVDSKKYIYKKYENEDSGDSVSRNIESDLLVTRVAQVLTLFPAVLSLTGGIIMLAKASKYEKLSTEPTLLTLNSVAPIIDPVSKTYGLSLGFSF